MEKTQVVQSHNRIEIAEKAFLLLFTLYATLTSCGFTFGKTVISIVMWPSLLLGILLIGYRILHFKKYVVMPFFPIMILMLVSIAVSTVLNYRLCFKENVVFCVYWSLYFLVLYTIEKDASVDKIKKDFRFVAGVFTAFISALVLLSFVVFFVGYEKEIYIENDFTYYIGFAIGRLWGVFVNLNRGAVSAAVASFLLLYFIKVVKKWWFRVLAGIMMFLNIAFIALSDSRSGAICLGFLSGFFTLFFLFACFRDRKIWLKGLAVLLAGIAVVVGYFLPRKIKTLYNDAVKFVYTISEEEEEYEEGEDGETEEGEDGETEEGEDGEDTEEGNDGQGGATHKPKKKKAKEKQEELELVDRRYDLSDDITNRRVDVWKSGIEIYSDNVKNMVVGTSFGGMVQYAEEELPKTYILNNDFGKIGTMDNDFFNLLVAQGAVGVLVVAVLAGAILILIIKKFKKANKEVTWELCIMLAVLFAMAGSSMVTSLVFYYFSQNAILFWAFLGLAVSLLHGEKGEKTDEE